MKAATRTYPGMSRDVIRLIRSKDKTAGRINTERLRSVVNGLPDANKAEIQRAQEFFWMQPKNLKGSYPEFSVMPEPELPEVAFLGRSNVGKSTLLDAILRGRGPGSPIVHSSKRPGKTRLMSMFTVGPPDGGEKISLVDMPGYGAASTVDQGLEIINYLEGRKNLKRVYLLINSFHGAKGLDGNLVRHFRQLQVPFQIVLTKSDRYTNNRDFSKAFANTRNFLKSELDLSDNRVQDPQARIALDEVIATAGGAKGAQGVGYLQFSILRACGLETSATAPTDNDMAAQIIMENNQLS